MNELQQVQQSGSQIRKVADRKSNTRGEQIQKWDFP